MTKLNRTLRLFAVALWLTTAATASALPPGEDELFAAFESAASEQATSSAPICVEPHTHTEASLPEDLALRNSIFQQLRGASQPPQLMEEFMLRQVPKGPITVESPGTDTILGMSWEPTIAVDPNNQNIVAVSQFVTTQVSFDGGDDNFPAQVTAPGVNRQGDPSTAFDDQGNFFITYLCAPAGGRDVCITGYTCDDTTDTCSQLAGPAWPVNVTAAAGQGVTTPTRTGWLRTRTSQAPSPVDSTSSGPT